ncbi:hypothetical protein SAMN04488032_108212 [Pacificibacter marinus]|uniref:Sulfotransferase domain protein n=1 Tax=Pacificibacter marinus TaxID=658057 RepID=A0A1Y5RZQ3_9RHOB|nr:hypothetical protein SAMN04488032_108212 [Pacificibacter marinus]SLN29138.1 hypothetical protein PAM7971_01095 [Pacificibacter marinus]
MSDFKNKFFWGWHILMNSKSLAGLALKAGFLARFQKQSRPDIQICIGTHHKVLTVLLARVFRVFSALTNRRYSYGRGDDIDYSADVLIDHHSDFDWTKTSRPLTGIHVTRDPRDLLVSAAFYHMKGTESWMHDVRDDLGRKSYHQYVLSLKDTEERLLFEIDNSGGQNIRDMLNWVGHDNIFEAKYSDLVGPGSADNFAKIVSGFPISDTEKRLVVALFKYFSLGSAGAKKNKHIRNASSGQWREHFTPAVSARFDAVFPDAGKQLGYDAN